MPEQSYYGEYGWWDKIREPEEPSRPLSDTGRAVSQSFTSGVVEPVLHAVRSGAEYMDWPNLAGLAREYGVDTADFSDDTLKKMSPSARQSFQAGVTTKEFWQNPGASTWFKLVGAIPQLAAYVGPAMLMPGGAIGAAAYAVGAGGVLGAGSYDAAVMREVDRMPDAKLAEQSSRFKDLLESGISSAEARTQFGKELRGYGYGEAINALGGAAFGLVGPPGQILRAAGRGVVPAAGTAVAERGVLGRMGREGAIGAGAMGAQGGILGETAQRALIEHNLQPEYDIWKTIDPTLTGAYLGAGIGAATGIPKPRRPADQVRGQPAKGAGTGEVIQPTEDATVGTGQGAKGSQREYPTTTPGGSKLSPSGIEIIPPTGPDAAQTQAAEATQSKVTPGVKPTTEAPPPGAPPPGGPPPGGPPPGGAGAAPPTLGAAVSPGVPPRPQGEAAAPAVTGPPARLARPDEPVPPGYQVLKLPQGVVHFDPIEISSLAIRKAAAEGRLDAVLQRERAPPTAETAPAEQASADTSAATPVGPARAQPVPAAGAEALPAAAVRPPVAGESVPPTAVPPRADVLPPAEPSAVTPGVGGFTTAKGSTYTVHPDGTTTRVKAARPEHPGDVGTKPRSARTYYLEPQDAQRLAPPQGSSRIVDHGDGTLSLAFRPNEKTKYGIADTGRNVPASREPGVGKIPLEVWNPGKLAGQDAFSGTHFGNPIVEMRPVPVKAPRARRRSAAEPVAALPVAESAVAPLAPGAEVAIPVAEAVPPARAPKTLPTLDPEAAARAKELHRRQAGEAAAAKEAARNRKGAEAQEKRVKDAALAKEIVDFQPDEPMPASPAERQALGDRLIAMVKWATDQGVKIPKQVKHFDPYIGVLRDAEKLGPRIKSGKATTKDIQTYLDREARTKAGMGEEIKAERSAEGELATRRTGTETFEADVAKQPGHGAVELPRAESPLEAVLRQEEGTAAEGATEQALAGIRDVEFAVPKGAVESLREQAEKGKTAGERNQAKAALRRIELAEKEAKEAAAKPQTPKEKLEAAIAKRRAEGAAEKPAEAAAPAKAAPAVVTRRGKFAEFKPKLKGVAEKISLSERDARAEFNRQEAAREDARVTKQVLKKEGEAEPTGFAGPVTRTMTIKGETAAERTAKAAQMAADLDLFVRGKPKLAATLAARRQREAALSTPETRAEAARRGEIYDDNGQRVPVIGSGTLREALARLTFFAPDWSGDKILPFVRARLMELVGDVPVHIMEQDDIRRLASGPAGGFYGFDGYVALNVNTMTSSRNMAVTVMHEATHAATAQAIRFNKKIRTDFFNLATEFMDTIIKTGMDLKPHSYWMKPRFNTPVLRAAEFVAEAMAKADVQLDMADTPISAKLARQLGMGDGLPRTMWGAFVDTVRRAIGMPERTYSVLEAVMRVTERALDYEKGMQETTKTRQLMAEQQGQSRGLAGPLDAVTEVVRRAVDEQRGIGIAGQKAATIFRHVMSNDQLAQYAARFWEAAANPVRAIADRIEMVRTLGLKLRDLDTPTIRKGLDLMRQHRGPQWDEFSSYLHDETMGQVAGDKSLQEQKFYTKEGNLKDTFEAQRAAELHPELARRYAALPEDLKTYRNEMHAFFRDRQNDLAMGVIQNRVLRALDFAFDEPEAQAEVRALAQRLHEGKNSVTKADIDLLGQSTVDMILKAKELSKVTGPYVPLMRRGDHVLIGKYKLTPPGKGRQLANEKGELIPTWEFTDKADAMDFYKKSPLHPDYESYWVDKNTGSRWAVEDGKEVKITSKDIDAEQRWSVSVQDRHVEFFRSAKEAQRAAHNYQAHELFDGMPSVQERKFQPSGREADLMSSQMLTLSNSIMQRKAWGRMSEAQRRELMGALSDMSVQMLGSTRVQSRSLPRTYVEGASHDFVQNLTDYSGSTSVYRARQAHLPALEAAAKTMRETVAGDYDKDLGRSQIANVLEERMWERGGHAEQHPFWTPTVNRLLSVSFLKHLASPAYSLLQPLQLTMITMPYLGGRHGYAKTAREAFRAADDLGVGKIVLGGLKEVGRKAWRGQDVPHAPLVQDMITRAAKNPREHEFFQHIIDRGSLDPDAGLEINALTEAQSGIGSKLDRIIGYGEGVARAMPRAMEAINRGVTGLTAYRLEFARTGDHTASMRYGQEAINNTQFLYSNSNMPPWFNKHPLARLALQFKKFGHGMYHLLGSQIGKAIKGATPEERMEGIKTLAGLAATHVLMAGALGLPSEGARMLMVGAKFAGLTDKDYEDVEAQFREFASLLGPTGGEIVSRGITRALPAGLGFDLSQRVGMDNPLVFGEPRSTKRSDIGSWFLEQLTGAPGAMALDTIEAAQHISKGDYLKGAEKLPAMKFGTNLVRAYRQSTEGTKTPAGQEQSKPYSVPEAIIRGIGFTPAREAEEQEFRRTARSQEKREKDKRTVLQNAWVNAKTSSDKDQAQKAINEWNRAQPASSKIAPKDLTTLAKRRKNDAESMTLGVKPTRRTEQMIENLRGVYSVH